MYLQTTRPTLVTGPTMEPLTITEAKKQCELSPNDTAHDAHIMHLIQTAREQWEHDTDSRVFTQTVYVHLEGFCNEICLPLRPIASVTSIEYYDVGNTLRTLGSSVYSLNPTKREVELKYQQIWPATIERWDAVKVTYVVGYPTIYEIPAIAKQAIRLLVGHYFENRDMLTSGPDAAYENLVRRFMRSTYP